MSPRNLRFTLPPSPHILLDFSTATASASIPPPSIPANIYHAFLHPAVPLTIATVYAATVHALNNVSNGTPYKIAKTKAFKYGVIIHNLLLAVYSAWTFVGMIGALSRSFYVTQGIESFVDSLCKIQDHNIPFGVSSDGSPLELKRLGLWNQGLSYYGFLFYLSKFYEVIDTLIILAKGKKSSTLQTYHHSGAMISMWAGIRYMGPPIWLFCAFNSLIHALMYTYYTLSTLRIKVPGILKRSLTTLQITQFLVGGGWAALYLFIEYRLPGDAEKGVWRKCLSNRGEEWSVIINCLYLAPLTYLFVRFFIKAYLTPKSITSSSKPSKKSSFITDTNGKIATPENKNLVGSKGDKFEKGGVARAE